MSFRITPERLYHPDGTLPTAGEIFVFGSNISGIHGAGAALIAKQMFGAIQGRGIGHFGQSYGLPTKDEYLKTLLPCQIIFGTKVFTDYTYARQDLKFFLTAVGCGYAGIDDSTIAPLFSQAINCSFPEHWRDFLE